jgi:hypothetical protein
MTEHETRKIIGREDVVRRWSVPGTRLLSVTRSFASRTVIGSEKVAAFAPGRGYLAGRHIGSIWLSRRACPQQADQPDRRGLSANSNLPTRRTYRRYCARALINAVTDRDSLAGGTRGATAFTLSRGAVVFVW